MNKKTNEENETGELDAPEKVAIEGKLPLTTIDIESQKDMQSGRYHPLRSLHKWFAARPTPAVRLAILTSVYPGEIEADELLKLMRIGPKALSSDITSYVERKFTEDTGKKTLDEHYDYPNPNTQIPTKKELGKLHNKLKNGWGGELPVIADPTAGRGTIPFEAIRYGLPAKANELNPVPALIMKVALEYAPKVGSVKPDVHHWRDEIHETAKKNIKPYYPTEDPGNTILNSALTYVIKCESCGGDIPLVVKWWLNKSSNGGDAIRPIYQDGSIKYEHVKVEEITKDFDPDDGPVKGGDAQCPHCEVVTENEGVRQKIANGEFKYSIYGVNYETSNGDRKFRGGSQVDMEGMEKAKERVKNDFGMVDFLAESYPGGFTDRVANYGVEEWKDMFTSRQLVVHYEYLQAFEQYRSEIISEYDEKKAEAILSILTLCASRVVMFNSRLSKWYDQRGIPHGMFAQNNFVLKKMGADNNLTAPRRGYIKNSDHVINSYENLAEYVAGKESADIRAGDAAALTDDWGTENIDVAIVDPPYYSSIQYGELSDIFYILQKEYLEELFPKIFNSKLTNKEDEAVANPSRFEGLKHDSSKKELANEHYENKMAEIFSEIYHTLKPNGVLTIMFTHREMDAWDTLTSALIKSGFTVTATHPIKTEMGDRIGVQDKSSADSSILLIGRKKQGRKDNETTLWKDIRDSLSEVAKEEARDIIDSNLSISKTDTAIATYGPTLQKYAEKYPVVNKKGDNVRPRQALSEARKAVTGVITDRFLKTGGIENLDAISRWYILMWLIYETNTVPFDEANQLGVAVGVDIDSIKRPTKIWRGGNEVQLQDPDERVQDIVVIRDDSVEDPSSRKYPVDPTDSRFAYTIDSVHSAIHVYDRDGARAAWGWLTKRNLKTDKEFEIAVTALLEVLPGNNDMYKTLVNLVSGETGDYLDINLDHIDMSGVNRQAELGDHAE